MNNYEEIQAISRNYHIDVEQLRRKVLEEVPLGRVVPVRGFETALSHYHIVCGDAALQKTAAAVAALAHAVVYAPVDAVATAATTAGITALALREDAVRRVAQDITFAAALPVL